MQERHLYRMLRDQMEAIGKLRIARHDAKNELLVLQGFLERGDAAARTYLAQLLRREDPLKGGGRWRGAGPLPPSRTSFLLTSMGGVIE